MKLIDRQVLLIKPAAATARGAAEAEAERRVGGVLVVEEVRLSGIFTERAALNRVLATERDPETTTLGKPAPSLTVLVVEIVRPASRPEMG